jgi:2-isopropylmalate synthase
MAVANCAGVAGGARQIECTVNGIGERPAYALEIVMAINVRNDVSVLEQDRHHDADASKLVSAATFPVQYNKAIVRNAFAIERHSSGRRAEGCLDLQSCGPKWLAKQSPVLADSAAMPSCTSWKRWATS